MLPLILASSSAQRLKLLEQIGVYPNKVIAPNIDETIVKGQNFKQMAARLAQAKAVKVLESVNHLDCIILAADSVVRCASSILPKAQTPEILSANLSKLSGRNSRLCTAICVIKWQNAKAIKLCKIVETKIKIKRLTPDEIERLKASNQGMNTASGLAFEGIGAAFVESIYGSHSNIWGLPLYETRNMLLAVGLKF